MGALAQILRKSLGRERPRKLKRHLRPDLSVEQFFAELRQRNVRYAVLRWFDELPHVRPGGDIDILVDDGDADRMADLFVLREKGAVRCDLFSVSGLPGTSYMGMSYFPADRARELLDRTVEHRGMCRVPAAEDHFLSLAYHAVYQKGLKSGLPTRYSHLLPDNAPEHDYSGVLARLATTARLSVAIDMEGLSDHLTQSGWAPDEAAIGKLAEHNPWVLADCRPISR